jgi:hypothetical protein
MYGSNSGGLDFEHSWFWGRPLHFICENLHTSRSWTKTYPACPRKYNNFLVHSCWSADEKSLSAKIELR